MPLQNFNHKVRWNEFRERGQRPRGSTEDAEITTSGKMQYSWSGGGNSYRVTSVSLILSVVKEESWVVKGKQGADLLKHEQGHFDIQALGSREHYNRLLKINAPSKKEMAKQIEALGEEIQKKIDAKNKSYDLQTSHGTKKGFQQTWEANIRKAKKDAQGTLDNL